MGIIGVTIWVIGVINLFTKSPDPPSKCRFSDLSRKYLQSIRLLLHRSPEAKT